MAEAKRDRQNHRNKLHEVSGKPSNRSMQGIEEALRESEERYRRLVELSPDAVIVYRAGKFVYVNPAAMKLFGATDPDQLIGKSGLDLVHPDYRDFVLERITKAQQGVEVGTVEEKFIRFDGRAIDVEVTTSPITYQGKPAVMIVGRDITERKGTVAEREQLSDRVRLLLESTDEGIYGLDENGKCIIFNKAACRMTGYEPKEALGTNLHNLIHHTKKDGSPYPAEECPIIRADKTGQSVRTDTEIFWRKDGSSFPVELSSSPIIEKGVIKGTVVTFADITERKRREAEREELVNKIQLLLQSTDQGIFGFDNEGKLTFINRAALEMTGFTDEELSGKNTHLMMHHSYGDGRPYPVENCPIFNATRTGQGVRFDTEVFWRKDGTSFPVEYSSYPIIEEREVKGGVVAFTDITARKRLEEEREKAKELSDAINSIDRAINSTLDFDEIMQTVVSESAKALGVDAASINLREKDHWVMKYSYGLPPELAGMMSTDEDARATALAAETKKPVISNDAYNDERVSRETMEKYGIRSFLITPLIVRGETIGVLIYSYHSAPIAFTNAQIEFAEKLADAASVAMENSRLYESLRQSEENLRRRARDLEMLNNLSRVLSQTLDLDTMLNSAIENVVDLFEADAAAIFMLDDESRILKMVVSRGLDDNFIKQSSEIPVGERFPGFIAMTGEPMIIDDLATYPEFEVPIVYETFSSLIGVPIKSKGKVIGAFPLSSRRRGKFTQVDRTLLEAIGNELGVAIENARLYGIEQRIADTLQEALLIVPEHINHLECGYLYRSATEVARVGGDFYDLFEIEHGNVGIVIGDVSGKGLNAAAQTSIVRNTIRAYAFEGYTPSEVMTKTNNVIKSVTDSASFVTVFFGILNEKTKKLTYCSAGHPPAIVKRKTGKVELLNVHSPVIGAFKEFTFIDATTALVKGDILLIYTDGLIEARHDNDFFKEERLVESIKELGQISPKDIPQILFNKVMIFTNGKLSDDVAVMAISLTKG